MTDTRRRAERIVAVARVFGLHAESLVDVSEEALAQLEGLAEAKEKERAGISELGATPVDGGTQINVRGVFRGGDAEAIAQAFRKGDYVTELHDLERYRVGTDGQLEERIAGGGRHERRQRLMRTTHVGMISSIIFAVEDAIDDTRPPSVSLGYVRGALVHSWLYGPGVFRRIMASVMRWFVRVLS